MSEILSCAGSLASECLVGLVGPHCGYVFCTDRKVRQLERELGELDDARERVGHEVEEARNNMRRIFPGVEKWVEKEQIVASKARSVLDGRAQKACCYGWLPNPKARYCLGKHASETVKEIQELIKRRNTWGKVDLPDDPPGRVPVAPEGNSPGGGGGDSIQEHIPRGQSENAPPGLVGDTADLNSSAADGGDIITGSRASIFREIMEALGDDKLKVIGVYGPGGVGKTTLLEEVEKKLRKEERPFHMIVKAKVSQNQDLTKIRYDIAYALGLNLKDEPSEEGKKDLLSKRLQRDPNEKVLIILDDLWDELDLKAVGIPSGDESSKCKLLLTSRYKDVLKPKMCADEAFHLKGLEEDEAFRLFEKRVGDRLKDDAELKVIGPQVVKKLAGLPLLINSVARTLKDSNVAAWRNALIKIEESKKETIVKLSYDHLKNKDARSLFLLCGLIGGTIQVETLLVLGMGLGLFEEFRRTMQDARDRLNTVLDELRSACLLLDGGNHWKNVYVTIHDVYSEVVVSTPFRGANSLVMNNNSWSEEKLEQCWAIYLKDVGSDRLAELMRCTFPDLKTLMLSQPHDWWGRPEHRHDERDCCRLDFTYMKQLRALYILSMHIRTLPSSIQILENLRSLYLNCGDVEDVAILGKLKALQILSFAGSAISRLPKEIGELTKLRSLNLSDCDKLVIIEPGVLKGLVNLEELLMRRSFGRWMGNDEVPSESCNAKLAELKSLTKLSALEISIPNPTVLLEAGDLPFGNLTRFWIDIGGSARDFPWVIKVGVFGEKSMMKLDLKGCDSILSQKWVQKTLHKTQYLRLVGLGKAEENANAPFSAHELCAQGFPQLKRLEILNSPSIKYVASSSGGIPLTAFTRLESLHLESLVNLEKICHGPIALECLSKLEDVNIRSCNRLTNLWCPSQMQGFPQLKHLEIYDSPSIEYIASSSGDVPLTAFTRLESLDLENLVNLEKICHGPMAPECLSKLKAVTVDKCDRLKYLWCLSQMQGFVHLEEINVRACESMRAIAIDDAREDIVELPAVRSLGLALLPRMTSFCIDDGITLEGAPIQMKEVAPKEEGSRSKGVVMSFPSLTHIIILECRNFGAFIRSPISMDRKLDKTAEENDESSQPLFNEMVKLPNVRSLQIEGARCKELWNNQIPDDSFCKLEVLSLTDCDNLRHVAPSHMWKRLDCSLDILQVELCRSVEIIYEGDDTVTKSGKLRWLILCDLENLRHIWQSDGLPNVLHPNLRFIEVQSCPRLRILFPTFTPEFLGQIQELVVESCEDMELIAGHEECQEATGTAITFSDLTALRLFKLPEFKSFLPEKYSAEFPSLQVLSRVSCGTEPDQHHGDWESYERCRESELCDEMWKCY